MRFCHGLLMCCVMLTVGCGRNSSEETRPASVPDAGAGSLPLNAPALPAAATGAGSSPAAPAGAAAPSAAGQAGATGSQSDEEKELAKQLAEQMASEPQGDQSVGLLQSASDSFYNAFNRPPASFQELIKSGYLGAVPAAPKGRQYVLDPKTGEVSSIEAR